MINKKVNIDDVLPAKLIKEIVLLSKTNDIDEDELKLVVQKVLKDNPKIAEDFANGKDSVIQFAIGQVMYVIKKRIDVNLVRNLIMEELK